MAKKTANVKESSVPNEKRTIYHVYADEYEVEGMFDEDGKLLGAWSGNDGTWRHEYFNEFLKKLGITVKHNDDEKLTAKLIAAFEPNY